MTAYAVRRRDTGELLPPRWTLMTAAVLAVLTVPADPDAFEVVPVLDPQQEQDNDRTDP